MSTYTHGHGPAVLRSHAWRTAANSAPHLLPHLVPGQRVLDVGCGVGTITADLAARVAPGEVLGVDSSASVVAAARASYDGRPGLRFEVGDVADLGEADRFDVVHAHQVLQHLADPVAALREMLRVARPGGLVAVRDADYAAMTWWPDVPGLDRWLAVYRAVARANGGEPDAGRRLLGWAHTAGSPAGSVTASASAWCLAEPADREWWAATWAERTETGPVAERAVALGLATPEELAAAAAGWRAWAQEPDGWFAVLHAELLIRVPAG